MSKRQRVECFRSAHIRMLSHRVNPWAPRVNPGLSFPGPFGHSVIALTTY
jgi:hypothetical protein